MNMLLALYYCKILGPKLVSFGHPPPRGGTTNAAVDNPTGLESLDKVVLSNGRVNRAMKIFEIQGFAFEAGTIEVHVGL